MQVICWYHFTIIYLYENKECHRKIKCFMNLIYYYVCVVMTFNLLSENASSLEMMKMKANFFENGYHYLIDRINYSVIVLQLFVQECIVTGKK